MMNGGTVPGGMKERERLTCATVSDIAVAMSVPSWKLSFIRAAPWMERDSTLSMPRM